MASICTPAEPSPTRARSRAAAWVTGSKKSAAAYGVRISGGAASLSNTGTIYGRNAAILVAGGGTIANQVGGLIKDQVGTSVSITVPVANASDILLTGSVAVTVNNAGTIGAIPAPSRWPARSTPTSAAPSRPGGISAVSGLYLNNLATGTIAGGYGVRSSGGPVSIGNAGIIHGNVSTAMTATVPSMTLAAVDFGGTGSSAAYLSNASSGVIYGYAGIRSAVVATVVNAGAITGHFGIQMRGGAVTNRAGGVIASSGNKLAGENAAASVQFSGYGTVLNAGTIGASATITQAVVFNGVAAGADYLSNALHRPGVRPAGGTVRSGHRDERRWQFRRRRGRRRRVLLSRDTPVNAAHGHIDGGIGTSFVPGPANTVINDGTIEGVGVRIAGPTTVLNEAGATIIANSGLPGAGAPVSLTGGFRDGARMPGPSRPVAARRSIWLPVSATG